AGPIAGAFAIAADPNFDPNYPDPDPAHPRTFRITLPPKAPGAQLAPAELGGAYTLTLGPDVRSQAGDPADVNLNAGLDVPRATPSAGTTVVTSPSASAPQAIGPGATITSAVSVPDSFNVQGATLKLDITFPVDSALTATLISPSNKRTLLFSGVGGGGQNFSNTTFDDQAATPIQNGGAPFFSRFQPQVGSGGPIATYVC